jgi:hypothetical protein
MTLCVIGNSHAAAIKLALGGKHIIDKHEVHFYVLGGHDQPRVQLLNGRLRPLNPHQRVETTLPEAAIAGLNILPYDTIVISACGWFAARNGFVAADPLAHPLGSMTCPDWAGSRCPVGIRPVSSAVFEAVVEGYVQRHASLQLAELLARSFEGRLLLQPWPTPDRALQSDREWFVNAWYPDSANMVWHAFISAQTRALRRLAATLGPKVTVLDYPLSDSAETGFMNSLWCTNDPWHANARYGSLVIDQIVAARN